MGTKGIGNSCRYHLTMGLADLMDQDYLDNELINQQDPIYIQKSTGIFIGEINRSR